MTMPSRSAITAVLGFACAVESFGYTALVPFLSPVLHDELGYSKTLMSLVFAMYPLGSVCASFVAPRLVKFMGCRNAIVASLIGIAFFQGVFSLTLKVQPPVVGIMVRFLAGMCAGSGWISCLVACHHMGEENVNLRFGTIMSAVTMGMVLGSPIGGLVYTRYGWHAPFTIICGLCVFCAALLLHCMVVAELPGKHFKQFSSISHIHDIYEAFSILALVFMGSAMFSSIDVYMPMHIHSVTTSSLVFGVLAACYGALTPLAGRIVDAMPRWSLCMALLSLWFMGMLLILASKLPVHALWVFAMAYGCTAAFQITPAFSLIDNMANTAIHPTRAFVLFNSAYVLGMVVGPGMFVILVENLGSFKMAAVSFASTAFLTSLLATFFINRFRRERHVTEITPVDLNEAINEKLQQAVLGEVIRKIRSILTRATVPRYREAAAHVIWA